MATARFAILLFIIAIQDGINCQSYGTLSTTLAAMESQLSEVSNSTEQMGTLLSNHDQQLDTAKSQQNVQTQILSTMVSLLQKLDQLDNLTNQQNAQNHMLTNVVALLQKHDQQLNSITHQKSAENQMLTNETHQESVQTPIFSNMSSQESVQNQILRNLSNQESVQNKILSNVVHQQSVQTQILSNVTHQQSVQNQILSNVTSQQIVQNQNLSNVTSQQIVQNQIRSNVTSQQTVQNKILSNMTHQQSVHNQILGNVTNQQIVQNQILLQHEQQLYTVIQQQNVQNSILANVLSLLRNHDYQLENMTYQQNVQNQISNTMVDLLEIQNETLTRIGDLQERQIQQLEDLTKQQTVQASQQSSIVQLLGPIRPQTDNRTSMIDVINHKETQNRTASSFQNNTASQLMKCAPHNGTLPQYCSDIVYKRYGVYTISPPDGLAPLTVYCDLKDDDSAWITFQRRFDGSENFDRGWQDYKNGFGDINGEHWLGLEKVHRLTRNGMWQLRVDLEDFSGNTAYGLFSNFFIGDASTNYRLNFDRFSGTAGYSLDPGAGMAFSTYDQDNDHWGGNCAVYTQGAWWHNHCGSSNLNAQYIGLPVVDHRGMYWHHWKGRDEVLKKSEMKMRRIW